MGAPTLDWLARASNSRKLLNDQSTIVPISIDSRTTKRGDTFWALRGKQDGHDFIPQAFAAGAKACVVSSDWASTAVAQVYLPRCIVVQDTLSALTKAASMWRGQLSCDVFCLTGSNGKTTTKELILKLLSTARRTQGTYGNLNNQLGVPITLLGLQSDTEIAVIELGASLPGEIGELSAMCQPTHGLVTSIGRAHLEGFGSMAALSHTKGQLYDFIAEHGVGFVPLDDELCRVEAAEIKRAVGYTFSSGPEHFNGRVYHGSNYRVGQNGTGAYDFSGHAVQLSVPGYPYAIASLAALTVADFFGIDLGVGIQELADWRGAAGRGQILKINNLTLIDDSYNANPASMRAALTTLASFAGRRMAILGGMAELGDYSDDEHRSLHREATAADFADVLFVGSFWKDIVGSDKYFATVDDLVPRLWERLAGIDTVLLKGSRSVGLDRAVKFLSDAKP